MSSPHTSFAFVALTLATLGACSSHPGEGVSGTSSSTGGSGTGGGGTGGQVTTTSSDDAGTGGTGNTGNTGDAGTPDPLDGTPTRVACTSTFGTAVTTVHGRMDGLLVSIVPPSNMQACNDDNSHVHLQVQMNGAVYDVAVNTDTLYDEIDAPLPGTPWAEGWHANANLDYPGNLGIHSTSFTVTTPTALAQKIESELASANHVSIFATGYGPTGAHDVHRRGQNEDGAIIIHPLDAQAHLLLFCFNTDTF